MKKAFVATFCEWSSVGSMMQSIGLQKELEKLGYESAVLQCSEQSYNKSGLLTVLKCARNPKDALCKLHQALRERKFYAAYQRSLSFMEQNVRMKKYAGYPALEKTPPTAEVFIAGSDQIWNPNNLCPLFALEFANSNANKIAYAASMGVTTFSAEQKAKLGEAVGTFRHVSVREEADLPLVQPFTSITVERNIDPVFFLTQDAWRTYQKPCASVKKPYVLVYAIYWDKKLNKELAQLHKKTGWDIVLYAHGLRNIYANKKIYDAGPAEFLWLMDNAAAVVTSSFHGLAFSLLFNKPVSAVINPKAPARMDGLLKVLGAEKHSILDLAEKTQNYIAVNSRIQEERQRSENWLWEALSSDE